MVLEGYRSCPDSHDLSECHHLYDLARHIIIAALRSYVRTLRPLLAAKFFLPPISLTVLSLTPKNYPWKPSGTTLMEIDIMMQEKRQGNFI